MSDHPDQADDNAVEGALAAALGHEPGREPPPDRVARVRAEAAARAGLRSSAPARTTGRRDLLLGGIAASAGALAGAAGAFLATRDHGDGDDDVPTEPIQFAFADDEVRSTASLINHTWGVELVLEIEGVPAGPTYQVGYERGDQPPIDAGSFIGVDAPMLCRFNAASLRSDTTAIVIRDADGAEIGRSDLV